VAAADRAASDAGRAGLVDARRASDCGDIAGFDGRDRIVEFA